MFPDGRWGLAGHPRHATPLPRGAVRLHAVVAVRTVGRTRRLVVRVRTVSLMVRRTNAFPIVLPTVSQRVQRQHRSRVEVHIGTPRGIGRPIEMVHVSIDTGCTHRMPVSILHTHIITPIVMAWSSSVVEAVLHVLVVPGLIMATATTSAATASIAAIVPVGVVQMVVG